MLNVLIITLSLTGFLLSLSIFRKKKAKKCGPLCSYDVIASRYSKTLGVSNEILGGLYYLFITAAALVLWKAAFLIPADLMEAVLGFVALSAFLAMAFSLYLVGVQIFLIRKYCVLCLTTAVINIALAHLIILP